LEKTSKIIKSNRQHCLK